MTAAARPAALLPPPELAPALAALLDGHCEGAGGDPAAWAAVRDILEESGRDPVVGGPEVEAFWDGVRWQPSYGAKPPLDWTTVSLSSGAVLNCLTDARCTLAEWLAHGPALARWHPLLRVSLTDREAHQGHYTDSANIPPRLRKQPFFGILKGAACEAETHSCIVPHPLWKLLKGWDWDGGTTKRYSSVAAVLAALSRAAILWARAQP